MYLKAAIVLCMALFPAVTASALEGGTAPKELSGMSILGNDEAPKSLYIVPWKSSEIGVETTLDMVLNDVDVPVDRDVFMRQLDFYEVSSANQSGRIK